MIIAFCMSAAGAEADHPSAAKPSSEFPALSEAAARLVYEKQLARTPPMGWNSWNAFEAKIDEQTIMQIADAMVASGMREAGYEYLVLDDGWMAKNRDSEGNLAADPIKFPSGMKAVGDYLHRKGLKLGIYEDRGYLTCQKLPGSFQHEAADMNIFAAWGVDYIKMDSCYAEKNGRLTSDHYTLFKNCIIRSGRPMVLSISDFGNGGWAWDGKNMAHLWRTSGDIYRSMDSVYHCADTTGGEASIHPAFNGLWQFAGPGHWNDPDMLQVGNLKTDVENRAHFSLWCILAAPLMAGNDLRSMSETVKQILTAREVIEVNQDPRGLQGYKVYNDGTRVIYNKPLKDGTTAVLLLNKGTAPADLVLAWDKVGLSGGQPVRDLWERKDLGWFTNSYTARALGRHGHQLLKVGLPGTPLPAPTPMPLEKYAVTRSGVTYLSDLYYIWKNNNGTVSDKNFMGDAITINGVKYAKGLGCRGASKVMYKLNQKASRFKAVVGLDDAYSGEGKGRFRVLNEDFFGNRVLFDSGLMPKGAPAQTVDVEVKGINCLLLVFEGQNIIGNWAEAQALAE